MVKMLSNNKKYRTICPKNFFFKKVNHTNFREFHGLFIAKNNFKPFWSYIDFGKGLT
jgi:hypothetical protein